MASTPQYFDELDGKPFDRDVLDRSAATVNHRARVCNLGCDPGQIARYLAAHGVDAFGVDASASIVATARRLSPTLQFCQGDPFGLPLADGELAGVAAFYCLIHCTRGELGRAVVEIHRVLMPVGRFLMAVHAGEGEVCRDEAYGKRVALVATLFPENEVYTALTAAGFRVDELVTREPVSLRIPKPANLRDGGARDVRRPMGTVERTAYHSVCVLRARVVLPAREQGVGRSTHCSQRRRSSHSLYRALRRTVVFAAPVFDADRREGRGEAPLVVNCCSASSQSSTSRPC
jgi:SAM-dependent methyltransferase